MFRDMKSTFGQTGTATTFGGGSFSGGAATSPFGQTFGKNTTTGFTAPAFGSTGSSLFGSSTPTTGGLFGGATATPVFGQTQTTQSSAFGFPSSTTGSNLFGSQPNANTSLFGTSGTSAFGANKPAFGGFGTSTGSGLFGQQQQQQQTQATPSLFGQSAGTTSTGIFGSGGFGASSTTAAAVGTPIKFTPVTGSDTVVKNGVTQTISTRHHCITCMKEYESKSLEELRLEDYVANRKGPQQAQQTGLFGTSTGGSLFGTGASTSTGTGGIFTDSSKSLFGGGFGTNSGGVFGSTNQQSGGFFGKSGFGTMTTTTGGGSNFSFNTTTAANPFGVNAQTKPFGTATPQTNSLFGTQSQPSAFGTQGTGFSGFGTQNQGIGLFNQNKPAFNMATTSTGFSFGQNTSTNAGSMFGAKSSGTGGFTNTFGNPTTSSFGTNNMFGANQNQSLFSQPFKPATTGFSFGQSTGTGTGLGGGLNIGGQPMFGNTANKPNMFGGSTGVFNTGGFGIGSTFPTGTGLGTSVGLGGNPLLGGAGTNPVTNQQGSGTVHQQILALASMPFGDSPLFRNLLPATGKTDELLKPTNPAAQKAAVSNNHFKVSPRENVKIKVKPLGVSSLSKKSLFEGLEEPDPTLLDTFQPRSSTKRLMLKPKAVTPVTGQLTVQLPGAMSGDGDVLEADKENKEVHQTSVMFPDQCVDSWLRKSLRKNTGETEEEQELSDARDTSSPLIGNAVIRHRKSLCKNTGETEGEKELSDAQDMPLLFRGNEVLSPGRRNTESVTDNTIAELKTQKSNLPLNMDDKENVSNNSSTSSDDSLEADEPAAVMEGDDSHPAGIVLRRVGYYTIPPLSELIFRVSVDGSCTVDNFTVGREGYGNVFFPDSFDVANLNLDEIVHFRHKEVMLYPNDEKKPPVGCGLNRRAQVTLDRVWPMDKTTRNPIRDPERLRQLDYEGKLRRVCAKLQTRFLEYRPQTGSWVFKVDHFSKYGLSDSDEEDVPVSDVKKFKPTMPLFQQQENRKKEQQQRKSGQQLLAKEISHGLSDGLLSNDIDPHPRGLVPVFLEEDQDMEEDEELEKIQQSPTMQLAREIGSPSHKVQLMKASFFMEEEGDLEPDFMELTQFHGGKLLDMDAGDFSEEAEPEKEVSLPRLPKSFSVFRTQFSAPEPIPQRTSVSVKGSKDAPQVRPSAHLPAGPWIQPPTVCPKIAVLSHHGEVVPLSQSSVGRMSAHCLADMGLVIGRSFRVGWGRDNTLLTLNTQKAAAVVPLRAKLSELNIFTSGRTEGDCSQCIVQRLQIFGGGKDASANFMEALEGHLHIQLQHCQSQLEDDCPLLIPRMGVDALHAHCALADQLSFDQTDVLLAYSTQVWKLCVALWGNLPDLDADSNSHQNVMLRREAVSKWLEDVVQQKVRQETAALSDESSKTQDKEHHIPVVLSLLSGRKILEACEKMEGCGDHHTSLLLAQLSGGPAAKQLIHQQLANWQDVKASCYINRDRIKLLMLVAGIPLFCGTESTVNVCEDLDWKRAFALHLWYICSPVASVTDALLQYEKAFGPPDIRDIYAKCPDPPYMEDGVELETSSGQPIWDLCFHLLKLYSSRSHPLNQLLNPATHTSDPLDYRLSWLLQQVLNALGYSHMSEYSSALVHTSFASQLESHGLWHWAIFVLLHLKNKQSRKVAVLDILGRHVDLSDNEEYQDRENFLCEQLNIPSQWIFEAKATLASACNRHKDAAYYLIKAALWTKSHEVIMKYIAADAIVNENYKYLHNLLEALVPVERSSTISGWNNRGQLLWDYLKIVAEVDTVLANQDLAAGYQLEKLQPQLSGLCARINMLPCPTAMDRLCQSEIAKRTVHVVRNVLLLQKGVGGVSSRVLAHLVTQLPLPEDYAQQELRQVVSSCMAEFTPC
ncbi:Nuclear pore complex protein Nup98-Nup96 [Cryptotermes secundus]|uniref:Nuclear pore complex protein Nup98-Nup96 n=1 Tax=Cryptotermes secundus TaxID=105785 RepID=A0A2J7PIF9_9NEOP|nr:Nuclear pore complex protein Nup98-Nup96 [Cryptotermes secundus]